MHGGGVGYFDATGTPQPDGTQMTENFGNVAPGDPHQRRPLGQHRGRSSQIPHAGCSYLNRDIYGGTGQIDPNNLNKNADGSARTTDGLQATKAAVAFTEAKYPTSKYFLAGGSAGSAGAYDVGWSEQLSGNPPAGVVGDASVVNVEEGTAVYQQGVCRNGNFDPNA